MNTFQDKIKNFLYGLKQGGQQLLNNAGQAEQQVGNYGQSLLNNVGNYFNPTGSGTQGFWGTPLAQGLANTQQSLATGNIIPQIRPFQSNQKGITPANIGNSIANIPGNLFNSIYGQGITAPTTDIVNNVKGIANNTGYVPYNQLNSGVAKLGYQAGGALNPSLARELGTKQGLTETLANVAQAGTPILSAYGGKAGGGVLLNAGKDTFVNALKQGLITGGKYGTGFGALGGLESGRNITDPGQYAQNLALNTAAGAGTGAVLGGVLGGGGYGVKKGINAYRSMTPQERQAGFVKPNATLSLGKDLQNTAETKATNETNASVAQDTRNPFSQKDIDSINQLKRVAKSKAFQEGDIETLRRTGKGDIVEQALQTIREKRPDIQDESQALNFALNFPTQKETVVPRVQLTPEQKLLRVQALKEQKAFEQDFGRPATPQEQKSSEKEYLAQFKKDTISQRTLNIQKKKAFGQSDQEILSQLKSETMSPREFKGAFNKVQGKPIGERTFTPAQQEYQNAFFNDEQAVKRGTVKAPVVQGTIKQGFALLPAEFQKQMETKIQTNADVPLSDTGIVPKTESPGLREALNRNQSDAQGTPLSNIPPGGLRDTYKAIYDRINAETPNDYGIGRQLTKTVEGRKQTGEIFASRLKAQIEKDLPNVESRQNVQLALDGSLHPNQLAPQELEVFHQLRPLYDYSFRIRQAADPFIKSEQDYAPRYPLGEPRGPQGEPIRKPLTVVARENFHREVKKFVSDQGDKSMIGTADTLGLRPSPDARGVFVDEKGNEWLPAKASIKEIHDAGVQKYELDVAKTTAENMKNTLKIKEQYGVIQALRSSIYDGKVLSSGERVPKDYKQINVRGLEGYYFEPKLAKAVEDLAYKANDSPKAFQLYKKGENFLVNTIFYNFMIHPLNLAVNAAIASGRRGGPIGLGRFLINLPGAAKTVLQKSDAYVARKDMGSAVGTFKTGGAISFLTKKQTFWDTLNKFNVPGYLYKANNKFVAFSDDVVREATYKALEQGGMKPQEAINFGDKFIADYGNTSNFEKSFSSGFATFYPWLKANVGNYYELGKHPVANLGSIGNLAILAASYVALQEGLRQYTGNKDARLRFPGMLGIGRDLLEAPGQIKEGRIPSIVSSHLGKPGQRELVQQIFNKDIFTNKPIFNPLTQGFNGEKPPTEAESRISHALNLVGPASPIQRVEQGKRTLGESFVNQAGVTLPHLKGYQAAPNLADSFLNQPNAKQGTGIEAFKAKQDTIKNLSAQDQLQLQDINVINQKLAQDPNNFDLRYARAHLYLANSQLLAAQTSINQNTAKLNGTDLNPLYALSPDAQKIVLREQSMNPGPDKTQFFKDNKGVLQPYYEAESAYFAKNPIQNPNQNSVSAPKPSAYVTQQMNLGNWKDSQVQDYLNQNTSYKNFVRQQLGLSPLQSGGSGFGYKQNLGLHKNFFSKRSTFTRGGSTFTRGGSKKTLSSKIGKVGKTKSLSLKLPKQTKSSRQLSFNRKSPSLVSL